MSGWGEATAWGRTGRVTLTSADADVLIDGNPVGWVGARSAGWLASTGFGMANGPHLPSRDAAVMWVLRRVDPKLWREERGAWLVRKRRPGEGVQRGWIDGEAHGYNDFWPWLVVDPSGVSVDATSDIPRAHYYANLYASETAT